MEVHCWLSPDLWKIFAFLLDDFSGFSTMSMDNLRKY